MSSYNNDLSFDLVISKLKSVSYNHLLMELSSLSEKHLGISGKKLFELLTNKEDNASSGIGDGIAIPHIQVKGPQNPFTILVTLDRPIDCEAIDELPVNLVCLILSPKSEGTSHLRRLSRISRLLKNQSLHQKLIESSDEQAMKALLINPEGWLLAA